MGNGQSAIDNDVILGIDLGTTNSLGAYMTPAGPVVVRDSAGNALVPSVIAFDPATGQTTVGSQAKAHAVENPLATVYSVKRLMGKGLADLHEDLRVLPYRVVRGSTGVSPVVGNAADGGDGHAPEEEAHGQDARGTHGRDARATNGGRATNNDDATRELVLVEVNGQLMTPEQLSAIILTEVRRRAEAALGRTIAKAVITVPAYFDDGQRQATRDAGRLAGLEVLRIVNEPTAAALAYGLERREGATVAVYDLGGGTFDLSILRIAGGVCQVLATHGDTHLGGDDLDRELIELVMADIRGRWNQNIQFPPSTRQALRTFAEATKIRLSDAPSATVEIDLGAGRSFRRAITREEFEGLAAKWLDRTIEHCRTALRDAGLSAGQIDRVIMVGGCTRIPYVRRRVGEVFGDAKLYTALNPDEVVAMGAAVQAGILAGTRRDLLLLDVTPLSLGIETLGGAMGKLIMRNTTVPCQASELFTTYVDGQTSVEIHVLQGERELAGDCRSLGRFQLRGIPPMPAGAPKIRVTFLIDANGILSVSAREERSGKAAAIQITPSHGLRRDEVERMVKESYLHAREDMAAHQLIDTRHEAQRILSAVDKSLPAAGGLLTAEQRRHLDGATAMLRARLAEDDADAIYAAMQLVSEAAKPLTEGLMDEVLKQTVKGKKLEEL